MKAIFNDHLYLFIVLIFFLAACNDSQSSPTILPTVFITSSPSVTALVNSSKESTLTPPSEVKSTSTPLSPTHSPSPSLTSTVNVPHLPTITPSITPTFDFSHLVTATKAPPETCPEVNSAVRPPDFENMFDWNTLSYPHVQQYYLDYFNAGGSVSALEYIEPNTNLWKPEYIIDLTNDGVPELVFGDRDFYILTCNSGKYELLFNMSFENNDGGAFPLYIKDANKDGIPEMLLDVRAPHNYLYYDLLEWDGDQFRSLFLPMDRNVDKNGKLIENKGRMRFSYEFVDNAPLQDLVISIDPPPDWGDDWVNYRDGYPWREEFDYYKWNGNNYAFSKHQYSDPVYRFQAINDGDLAFLYGDYNKAISSYQSAIHDENLFWYTEERRANTIFNEYPWKFHGWVYQDQMINHDEYPNLAAYAYSKIMLTELKTDHLSSAQNTYNTLQTNFRPGSPGGIYSELAKLFWDEYQKSTDMGQSCLSTYNFINDHLNEIFHFMTGFVYINGEKVELSNHPNFGYQNSELKYSPDSVCPSK